MKLLSIVVPCYNEEPSVPLFYEEVTQVLEELPSGITYELVFVNDGSKDSTLSELKKLAAKDGRVIYLSFSRNFGKESAMYAGLCNAKGDYVAVMDADLQHPPALLPEMVKILETGEYDCVATKRATRTGEPVIRSFVSGMFYHVLNKISDAEIVNDAMDYRMMNRHVVNSIISMGEYNRFSKGIYSWVGYRIYWMSCNIDSRVAGNTKWSMRKLFHYAIDGILGFSLAPLSLVSWTGLIAAICSALAIIITVFKKLVLHNTVEGWASTMCIIVFIGGLQLFCLGVIAQYIAKIYMEVKRRPHYIISESNREDVKEIL